MRRSTATDLFCAVDETPRYADMRCARCGGSVDAGPVAIVLLGAGPNGADERAFCGEACARASGWPQQIPSEKPRTKERVVLKLAEEKMSTPLPSGKSRAPRRDRGQFSIGEIEDDIPIPRRKGKADEIPFEDLKVGQSILLTGISVGGVAEAVKRSAVLAELGREFTAREMDDGSVRCWRTK